MNFTFLKPLKSFRFIEFSKMPTRSFNIALRDGKDIMGLGIPSMSLRELYILLLYYTLPVGHTNTRIFLIINGRAYDQDDLDRSVDDIWDGIPEHSRPIDGDRICVIFDNDRGFLIDDF